MTCKGRVWRDSLANSAAVPVSANHRVGNHFRSVRKEKLRAITHVCDRCDGFSFLNENARRFGSAVMQPRIQRRPGGQMTITIRGYDGQYGMQPRIMTDRRCQRRKIHTQTVATLYAAGRALDNMNRHTS
ncbi:hypothetical protein CF68_33705 [Cupriavidus sp. SK-4]|nr:hypothetical protein CF68_33705 [Cupriavidus sp. SK-4]